MRPTRWRQSTHVAVGVVVLVLVAAVVAVAAVLTGHRSSDAEAVTPAPAARDRQPGDRPGGHVGAHTHRERPGRRAGAGSGRIPISVEVTGRITDAETGAELWEQNSGAPMQPASVNKVLTTAAALLTLDRNARLATTVLAVDSQPGLVVLKGGGDTTLSAAPEDTDTWYKGAARISDLAEQVRNSGITVTAVRVDTSEYSGPTDGAGLGSGRHRGR